MASVFSVWTTTRSHAGAPERASVVEAGAVEVVVDPEVPVVLPDELDPQAAMARLTAVSTAPAHNLCR